MKSAMRKWVFGSVAVLAFAIGGAWGGLQLSNSRTHQLAGDLLTRVETSDSVIAITFDDGPIPVYTDSTLDVLDEFGARATFFMVGERMEQRPRLVGEVLARGHEIGNHSYNHPIMVLKRWSTIRSQIERTDSIIRAAGQEGEIWFRPPDGKRLLGLPLYLSLRKRPIVLWDLEPDSEWRNADEVVQYVLDRVRPGSILLLHTELPVRTENRIALRRLLPLLSARGYRFVTLSELVSGATGQP
jgi:peptidoglycan-N-acetylglucosamine deacetylase